MYSVCGLLNKKGKNKLKEEIDYKYIYQDRLDKNVFSMT